MSFDWLEVLVTGGGIGAVMAIMMFTAYKWLVRQVTEERKTSEERMARLLLEYNQACRDSAMATREHTKAVTELYVYLKMRNGNPSRG